MIFGRKNGFPSYAVHLMLLLTCLPLVACLKDVPEPVRLDASSLKKTNSSRKSFALSDALAVVGSGGACNFDLIGGVVRDEKNIQINRFELLQYIGWAALDIKGGVVGQDVTLVLSNEILGTYAISARRVRRSDLVEFFAQPALMHAGFMVKANAANLPVGEYTLSVLINEGKRLIECGITKRVSVK